MGCLLQIGVIGINQKIADLTFRESIARAAVGLSGEAALFFAHPIVLLSTCNRTEIYFGGDDLATAHSDILNYLRKQIPEAFEHRLYSYFGMDCFTHIGRVVSGLDSAIIAETEIQRQVKVAYAKGTEFSDLTSCMHYVFQKSLKIGKFIRTQFQLDRSSPTLAQSVWHLAKEVLGNLLDSRILLVGHSDMNRTMAAFLAGKGVSQMTLATQHPASVLPSCLAVDREELGSWREYDLIICAASSDRYLISGSSDRRQAVFDLSVPRNVDPDLAGDKLVLYNIEGVNKWMEQKQALQVEQLNYCYELIVGQTLSFARAYRKKVLSGNDQYAAKLALINS
jgi:glutamyl-tRNA reductase